MKTYQQEPRVIQRHCGGWIARSNREDRLQIGVTGKDRSEAVARYGAALRHWERLFECARAIP